MSERSENLFTLSVLTECESGALVRLTTTLARHRLSVRTLTSTSEPLAGSLRHIVLVEALPDRVRRAMKQIQATVGVLQAGYYPEGGTVEREVALYKLNGACMGEGTLVRDLVRIHRARVILWSEDSVIIEKTGCGRDIEEFCEALRPFGVMEFVRSGRVMVTRAGSTELTEIRTASGNRANGG